MMMYRRRGGKVIEMTGMKPSLLVRQCRQGFASPWRKCTWNILKLSFEVNVNVMMIMIWTNRGNL
jgi:hypothetical protein